MAYHSGPVNRTREMQAHQKHPLAEVQIVLIEDEFDIANLPLFILEDADAEVVWVMWASAALAQLAHFQPDVLKSTQSIASVSSLKSLTKI